MNTIIRTAYGTHPTSGASRIVAKGGGKQRTVPFDPSKSSDWNHGNAAGEVARLLFVGKAARKKAASIATHDSSDDGTKHGFGFTI